MLRDMNLVFENAEATAIKYQERLATERLARETAAKEIVAGLEKAMDGKSNDIVSVADSIESILASIVSSNDIKQSV